MTSEPNVLGFYIFDGSDNNRESDKKKSFLNIISHIFRIYHGQDEAFTLGQYRNSIIRIDISPIQTLDFNLTDEDKELLIEAGKVAVIRYLLLEDHGLPYWEGQQPDNEQYQKALAKLAILQRDARKRWKWPHRFQRLRIYFAAVMTILILISPVVLGAIWITNKHAHNRLSPPSKKVINIAILTNGKTESVHTVEKSFEQELITSLMDSKFTPRFARDEGDPYNSIINQNKLKQLYERFASGPDYLVTIGTRVSMDAHKNYLGRLPILFIGITDPIKSGLVETFDKDSKRGNIAGLLIMALNPVCNFFPTHFLMPLLVFYMIAISSKMYILEIDF